MPKQIKFSKWIDPLQVILDQHENDADDSPDYESDDFENKSGKLSNLGPCIVGPQGIIPIHEFNLPGRIYNFWLLHTNFRLTKDIVFQIENVDGVESLNIFTPYRARFSIGYMFKADDVMNNLRKQLCTSSKVKTIDTAVYDNIEKWLSKKYKYWAMVTTNSVIKPIGGDTIEYVNREIDKIQDYSDIKKSW